MSQLRCLKKRQRDLLNDKYLKGFFYGESGYAWTFQIPTDMVYRCLVGQSACMIGWIDEFNRDMLDHAQPTKHLEFSVTLVRKHVWLDTYITKHK
jgi:hypothetical protein